MTNIPTHSPNPRRYQELLDRLPSFPDAMNVSRLHGFLTGITVGPASILQRSWLSTALGLEETTPPPEDLQKIAELALDELSDQLLEGQIANTLSQWNGQGTHTLQQWSQGFLDAVQLAQHDWRARLQQNQNLQQALDNLKILADPISNAHLLAQNTQTLSEAQLDELCKNTPSTLETLVLSIPLEEPDEDPNPPS